MDNSSSLGGAESPPACTWRLIPWLDAPGQVQMAIDRWLFQQHQLGLQPPTLRFYTWSPVAISLGYHQKQFPDHWRSLTWKQQPIDLVHRPSGGRAVLHQGDLTYAVIASGFSQRRMVAYQEICQFLIEGWRSLQVPLYYGNAGRGYLQNPNCFGTATSADLVLADGTKLIGSAQMRQGNVILQHGSIRLESDASLFEQVFQTALPMDTLGRLKTELQTKMEALKLPLTNSLKDILMNTLTQAAEKSFNMTLVSQPLSNREWKQINHLVSTTIAYP
jgi:lipoate---protein ligase